MTGGATQAHHPIGDYALIGDCRSAALVSRDGSLDWLCWPRFDSPSIFAALLDSHRGGRFTIAPVADFTATRRYLTGTAVLETTFTTASGVVRLTDLMPVASERDKARELWPDHELLRKVECVEGSVEIEIGFDPRPDYGRMVPRLIDQNTFGLLCEFGADVLAIRSEIPLIVGDRPGARGRARLQAGEARMVSVTYDRGLPMVLSPIGGAAEHRIARSAAWWRDWVRPCCYEGPYVEVVRRSAITLKLLTFAPSGALIAAPTTSLPEQIGGLRNWDYRYCWLRDASLSIRAFDELGFPIESEAFLSWVLHATRMTWPELQILYDVYGGAHLPETVLDHLEGYARSAPVRTGNAAADQLQLDIYGEVIDAASRYVDRGGRLDRTTARALVGFGDVVVRQWREPDEGIWEPRSGRQHHTHSKAMCWVAMDRLARLCALRHVPADAARFSAVRDEIRDAIETHGFSQRQGSYVSVFGGEALDASLLLLSLMGYADPRSARMRGTVARVRERLGVNGLLYRYLDKDDGVAGSEGAFGICSFWGVEALALQGEVGAAGALFDHLLSFGNDLALFAEEIDPHTRAALGNFPQAFTHVGLINAALTLARLQQEGPMALDGSNGTGRRPI
jgi:GH15 family glucan-1,4-alpha-glucosidase